jgi:hypothetical protein
MKCRICGKDGAVVITEHNGRPVIAHEQCFIEWAKAVLRKVSP